MKQVARNVTAMDDGCLVGKRFLLMDRDSKFSAAFRQVLSDARTESVRLPPQSPNLNAHMVRLIFANAKEAATPTRDRKS
jgi:hypothetical protein